MYQRVQGIKKTRSMVGGVTLNNLAGKSEIGPVSDVFVSEDQGLMCMEIKVPSPS